MMDAPKGFKRRQYRSWMRTVCPQSPRSTEHYRELYSRGKRKTDDNRNNQKSDNVSTSSVDHSENVQDGFCLSQSTYTGDNSTNPNEVTDEGFPFNEPIITEDNSDHSEDMNHVSSDNQSHYFAKDNINVNSHEAIDESAPLLQGHSNSGEGSNEETPLLSESNGNNYYSDGDASSTKRPQLDNPVPNLQTTIFECLLMILTFSMRHSLTAVAVEDLCKLVNCMLGSEIIPTSKYLFNKVFCSGLQYRFHLYCSKCECYLGELSSFEPNITIFPCSICGNECSTKTMNEGHFFISLPIEGQLVSLLENTEDVLNLLANRFKHNAAAGEGIRDIYDGNIYREFSKDKNILSDHHNLSVTFNTDGAPVFESTKNSLWPIHFRINEFPPKIRYNQGNSMVAGLWFGNKEPNRTIFLSRFVEEANKLYMAGFNWPDPNGNLANSKVIVLNCVVDSKAKPLVQNIKQFNGYYGCGYCYHPGIILDEGGNQAKYVMNDDVFLNEDCGCTYTVTKVDRLKRESVFFVEDRNNKDMRRDMDAAERRREIAGRVDDGKGVKGISPLCVLPFFDVVFGFSIDYMHAVLLGVTKMTACLWLDSSSHHKNYYIGNRVDDIDKRLSNIRPPSTISRRPRSISERGDWKANEWRTWLLFYSLPCLKGILPDTYLRHHCVLVTAIQMFLQDYIAPGDLDRASWYLIEYVLEFQRFYGAQYMYYNVHLLLHLGKCVHLWGPLWCYSAFSFESGNGCLLKLIKGTRGVASQIAYKYSVCKFIPKAINMYNVSSNVLEYCSDLMCYRTVSITTKCGSVTILGSQKMVTYTVEEQNLLEQELNNGQDIKCSFERMIKDGVIIHARCYSRRGNKSDDSVVKLLNGGYAVIEKFFKLYADGEDSIVGVLVRTINITKNKNVINHRCGANALHIKVASQLVYGSLKLLRVDELDRKAILISCGEETYVSDFPNYFEKD